MPKGFFLFAAYLTKLSVSQSIAYSIEDAESNLYYSLHLLYVLQNTNHAFIRPLCKWANYESWRTKYPNTIEDVDGKLQWDEEILRKYSYEPIGVHNY